MDLSTLNIWYWLILILVAIICLYIGYSIGKGKNKGLDDSENVKLLQNKNTKLKADLEVCNTKLTAMTSLSEASAISTPDLTTFDAKTAKNALGKNVKKDDLKVIEGIGPKIEGMFKAAGITTWKELSETAVARCHEILKDGGERYKIHDPASWPMQAKMCSEGKWTELARWQNEHDYGKL